MKSNIPAVLFIILLSVTSMVQAQESKKISEVNELINKIRSRYAPDKRTVIFNVEAIEENDEITVRGETNLEIAKLKLLTLFPKLEYSVNEKINILPGKELGDKVYGVINLSVANIRSRGDHPAEMSTQALLGMPVKIYKQKEDFTLVQTLDDYIAWADDDALVAMTKEEINEWNRSPKVIYSNAYGFSYIEPQKNSQHVSDLVKGDILKFICETKGYMKVEYPDKRTAYVPAGECEKFTKWLGSLKLNGENLVKTAKTFMGIPYLWGGTSMKGVDCSGFTKSVYYLNGVILPRDASQQVDAGELIETKDNFNNLQPGDLLFFGVRATETKKEKATHVAMYIGNDEYIHSSGMVKINSLDKNKPNFNQHRFDTFLKARRIITSIDKNGVVLLKNNQYYQEKK